MVEPSRVEIIADIKRVADELRIAPGQKMGRGQYRQGGGKFTEYQIYDVGSDWTTLCTAAEFVTKKFVT